MNPAYDFTGQVAVVTGAGSGMGLVTAQAFAEAGAAVVLSDINEAAVTEAAEALSASGHKALAVACDVADESQVAAMIARTVALPAGSTWPSTTLASRSLPATQQTSRQQTSTVSRRSTYAGCGRA